MKAFYLLILFITRFAWGACASYEAKGVLTNEKGSLILLVNKDTEEEYHLRLTGSPSRFGPGVERGRYIDVKGHPARKFANYRGELNVDSARLIAPDPLSADKDQLRCLK